VIYLGINDVWHGEKGTTKSDFESGLNKMVDLSKSVGATIVLCTPTVIGEETKNNEKNKSLAEYAGITRSIAKQHSLVLCDLHTVFVDQLKKVNPEDKHQGNLTYDGVHMNEQGSALLAEQIALAIRNACQKRTAIQ
jgi:lysophospholipase L1-like esterase